MNGSVMSGSVINMVCYESGLFRTGLLWMGLLWTLSVLNGLLWVVCYERVCFEWEPDSTDITNQRVSHNLKKSQQQRDGQSH